ncbi:MAG: secretin and TonB N-terminal domain-containing protein [Candidatus Dadabacteria bacterium]|nr:secretin and TonB N-terminal domain-containing protein [Candidatus Dadabacteria bacterium]
MNPILKAFFAGFVLTVLASFLNSESSGLVIQEKNEKKTSDVFPVFNPIEVGEGYLFSETTKGFLSRSSASTFTQVKQIAQGSNTVESIGFEVQGLEGVVTIRTSKPVKYGELLKKGRRLDLKLEDVSLPDDLQVSRDVNEFDSPVSFISTFRDPDRESDVLVVVELKEDTTSELNQQRNILNVRFKKQSSEEKLGSGGKTNLVESGPQASPRNENEPTDLDNEDSSIMPQEHAIQEVEKEAASKPSAVPLTQKAISAAGINIVEGVDFKVKKGVGILTIKTSQPVRYEKFPEGKNKLNLKLVNVFLPDELQDSRTIKDLKSPVSIVSTFRDAERQGDVIVVLELTEDSAAELSQEENLLTVKLSKQLEEERATESEKTDIAESQPTPEPSPPGQDAVAGAKQENPPITFEKMVTAPGTQTSGSKSLAQPSQVKESRASGLNSLENIYFKAQKGVGTVTIKTSIPVGYEEIVKEEKQITLKLEDVSLSNDFEIARDVKDIDSPVNLFTSFRETGKRNNVIVVVELKENVPFQLNQDDNFINLKFGKSYDEKLAEETEAVSEDSLYAFDSRVAAVPAEKKTYRGQIVSFDFKDADVRDVVKILTDVSGFNFVVSKDVEGKVTLKLNRVPWDKALDVVLESAGLGAIVEGKVIKVTSLMPMKTIERIMEPPSDLKEQPETFSSKQVFVNYASADKLIPLVKPLLSPRGDIRLVGSTNSLLITDTASMIKQIEEHVKKLDIKIPQVIIEARIVRAKHDFTPQLGVDWSPNDLVSGTLADTGDPYFASSTFTGDSIPGNSSSLKAQGNNSLVNLPVSSGKETDGAFRVMLGTLTGAIDLDTKLSEFEKRGDVTVLSSPKVSTLDNQPARIDQVVSIPSLDGSPEATETRLVDTNFTFEITPNVTDDKKVLMDIKVTDNYPAASLTEKVGQPAIKRNKMETQILAMGGETIVVRCLFASNQAADKESELIVFLTPWIIK